MRKAILFVLIFVLFSGCATINKGTNERVLISTIPSSAKVEINGEYQGETPVSVELKTDFDQEIVLTKEGYKTLKIMLKTSVNKTWIWLDIISFVVPVAVDAYTGDWKTFDTNKIHKVLEKNNEEN